MVRLCANSGPGFTTISNTEMFKLKKNRDVNLRILYNTVATNYNTITKLYYSYKVRINFLQHKQCFKMLITMNEPHRIRTGILSDAGTCTVLLQSHYLHQNKSTECPTKLSRPTAQISG